MLSKEALDFISYYTGNYRSTIEDAYKNYLLIKDDSDFEEFHPNHKNLISTEPTKLKEPKIHYCKACGCKLIMGMERDNKICCDCHFKGK